MSEWDREDSAKSARVERLYSARTDEVSAAQASAPTGDEQRRRRRRSALRDAQSPSPEQTFAPNEEAAQSPYAAPADPFAPYDQAGYDETAFTPNEEPPAASASAPEMPEPVPDYSAYYRADAQTDAGDEAGEPTYAPPTKLSYYSAYQPWQDDAPTDAPAQAGANVYRPREATWAETARQKALSNDNVGYQVRDEEPEGARSGRKRHGLRNTLIVLAVLAILGGAAYLFREPLTETLGKLTGTPQATEPPFTVVSTPAPAKGYDASPKAELSQQAQREISAISGLVDMETVAVTQSNVLARSSREDGKYDFYLFSAEGALLCYFEGLDKLDAAPMDDGGFYVGQAPYLVKPDGSAMLALDGLEASVRKSLKLKQMLGGWAIVCDADEQSFNYLNADGQLLSALWFSRAYPFTGDATAAYVDTGAVGSDERYMLYALAADGTMTKMSESADMSNLVASACGAAYMSDGSLYLLDDPDAAMMTTDDVAFYPDCGAMVVRDPDTGKYGLFVGGEKHYDFQFDDVKPVECDLEWARRDYDATGGRAALLAVTDASYPQPLTYYFELSRNGSTEYVALSAATNSPILLDIQP